MSRRPKPRLGRFIALAGVAVLVGACGSSTATGVASSARTAPNVGSPSATPVASVPARATPIASASGSAGPSPGQEAASTITSIDHVWLVIMENRDYGAVIGSPEAPFINGLAATYGLATDYFAVTHPSQPNYLALFSGSTQGVADDGVHNLGGRNLVDQLESRGRTWKVFAENVPLGCYTGAVASGGPDGPGTFARKHDPAISFTDVSGSPARCANIEDFSHFDPAAADFELIVPNLCHDGHDCSTAQADAFLRSFVPKITGSTAFSRGALFVVWDEAVTAGQGGGRVPLVVASPLVRPGVRSAARRDHYSLLRTIEDIWGLGCLNAACSAADLAEYFR